MKKCLEEHYDNGQLAYRWNYFNNIPHGIHIGYRDNGKWGYRINYIMGEVKGLYESSGSGFFNEIKNYRLL